MVVRLIHTHDQMRTQHMHFSAQQGGQEHAALAAIDRCHTVVYILTDRTMHRCNQHQPPAHLANAGAWARRSAGDMCGVGAITVASAGAAGAGAAGSSARLRLTLSSTSPISK